MTNRLIERFQPQEVVTDSGRTSRLLILGVVGIVGMLMLGLLAIPMLIGTNLFFASSAGCSGQQTGTAGQAPASPKAKGIPANYLSWYQRVGKQYNVPWTILAGIGTVESDNGQTTLPGVHSGANSFGAAGPMQIGIGGAAGDAWGGAAVHPASEAVNGVATDEDGDGIASVYDPADAIAGTAKYLLEFNVQSNPSAAIFAYNHLQSYVQTVLYYASVYAGGKFSVVSASLPTTSVSTGCYTALPGVSSVNPPNQIVRHRHLLRRAAARQAVPVGRHGTRRVRLLGPGHDGLPGGRRRHPANVAAAVDYGPRVSASQVQPGDLVFFAGSDGTRAAPGHEGIVIGNGKMIEAYATGFPIRVSTYTNRDPVGFTRPWARPALYAGGQGTQGAA